MRLINAKTFQLEDFGVVDQIPVYVILSHTWTNDEVTYEDMSSARRTQRSAWHKVTQTCMKALELNVEYAWIDTCCIDKSSSAELSEAINSMFKWYADAYRCISYLADVPACTNPAASANEFAAYFKKTRWVTRGWTLQELIAPTFVDFYDSMWEYRSCKQSISKLIAETTRVPEDVLLNVSLLASYSVCARLSWASHRHTTCEEDEAYSLLGILNINMPLIYGEGRRAFRRLQDAIIADRHDLTIFCHSTVEPTTHELFAHSPFGYRFSADIKRFTDVYVEYTVMNQGVRMAAGLPIRFGRVCCADGDRESYCLMLGYQASSRKMIGICMSMTAPGQFCRDASHQLIGIDIEWESLAHYAPLDFLITSTVDPDVRALTNGHLDGAIELSNTGLIELDSVVPIPQIMFDMKRRVFLHPPRSFVRRLVVFAAQWKLTVSTAPLLLTILIDCRKMKSERMNALDQPQAKVFLTNAHQEITDHIFLSSRVRPLLWPELELQFPIVRDFNNTFTFWSMSENRDVKITFKNSYSNKYRTSRICAQRNSSLKACL